MCSSDRIDGTESEIARAYKTIRAELASYGHGLARKPEIVALNKTDAIPKDALARKIKSLEKASGRKVHAISGVSGAGVNDVLRELARKVEATRKKSSKEEAPTGPVKATAKGWAP